MSAGAFSLGTLIVEIEARTAEAAAVLQKFGDDSAAMIDQQKAKWDGLAQVGQQFMAVGGALTAGITLPLVGMAAASLDAAGKFEASMNKVSALGDITGADFKTLQDAAIKWGADTQFSAQQAADAMGELAAKGQNATQIMSTMPGVLALAAAGQTSLAEASTIATNTIAQFGLQSSDSGKVADVLAAGAAQSAAGVKELGSSLNYVAPIAKSAGLSLEETVGTLAVLSNNGIEATKAGTSLRGMIASLEAPSKKAGDTLAALGVNATDSSGKLMPLNDIMLQLKESGATTADMFNIFGREGATAASVLKDNAGPALDQMTKSMQDSEGAAQKMADQLNQGIGFGMEQLKGSVETAAIQLGQTLAPAFNAVVAGLTALVNKGTEFLSWFGGLPAPIQDAVITFGALAAAIGPIVLGLGAFMTAIGTLMPGLTSLAGFFGTSILGLGGWALAIAGVVAALVALGVWVYQNWDTIKTSLATAWDTISAAWSGVWTTIQTALETAWNSITAAATAVWDAFMGPFGATWDAVQTAWSAAWTAITGALQTVWDTAVAAWSAYWDAEVSIVSAIWDAVKTAWSAVWEAIKTAVSGTWDGIKAALSIFDGIAAYLLPFWDPIKKAFTDTWDAIAKALAAIWGGLKDTADAIFKALGKIFGDSGDDAKKAQPKIEDHAKAVAASGDQAKTAAEQHGKLAPAIENTGKKAKAAADNFKPLKAEAGLLMLQYKDLQKAHDDILQQLNKLQPALKQTADQYAAAQDPTKTLTTLTDLQTAAWEKQATITTPKILTSLGDYKTAVDLGTEAAKQLGIKSEETGAKTAAAAQAAYQAVLNNPMATEYDKQKAAVVALKAEIDAVYNSGESYEGELQTLSTQLQAAKTAMGDFSGSVTTVDTGLTTLKNNKAFDQIKTDIGGAVDEIIGKLSKGDLSLGATMKTLFTNIGEDALHLFVDPMKTAVEDFIKNTIADLLGGKGFGGIKDALEGIGTAFGKLFGKGVSTAADVAGGAADAAGGAAQAGGGAASAAGGILSAGVTSLVGMVSGVVSAVTGVIGVFQAAHQETSLNAIEHNTRYTMMYVGERADGGILGVLFKIQENTQWVQGQLDGLNLKLIDWLSPLHNDFHDMGLKASAAQTRFDEISNNTLQNGAIARDNTRLLADIRDLLAGQKPAVNIYVSGAQSPAATADAIGAALRAQGAFA